MDVGVETNELLVFKWTREWDNVRSAYVRDFKNEL